MAKQVKKDLEAFKQFIEELEPYVAAELERRKTQGKPEVVSGLSESDAALAEKMVAIQNLKSCIVSGDLTDAERMRIRRVATKHGITTKEAISLFVKNDNFMTSEMSDASRLLDLVTEIANLYRTEYEQYQSIPVCLLSASSRDFLLHKHYKASQKEQIEAIIQRYIPELSSVKVEEYCFDVRNTKKRQENQRLLSEKVEEIQTRFADEQGYVDGLFKPENREYLKELISQLSKAKISFDEFVTEQCGKQYSRIFRLDPAEAVKHMVWQYYQKHGTFSGIRENDPFLEAKIVTAKQQMGVFETSALLAKLGFVPDFESKKANLPQYKLDGRQAVLVQTLSEMYPDGVISEPLTSTHEKISDECVFLARRNGYDSVDSYLLSIGFSRVVKGARKLGDMKIYLTENDLLRYKFALPEEIENFENIGTVYGAELVDVENNVNNYSQILQSEQMSSNRVNYSRINITRTKD